MIDQTKCSRCEAAPAAWVHLYFVDGDDLPLCAEHGRQFASMHPFGPRVSGTPYSKRPKARRRNRGR